MIEVVDGFEGHEQRWVAVLLENAGSGKRRFQTMGGAMPDHFPEAAQGAAARRQLLVVGQAIEPVLDALGRAQTCDQAPLGRSELMLRHASAKWFS
jgi:hypothetical protein